MTTFKQFLIEEPQGNLEQWTKQIKQDCPQALRQFMIGNEYRLYRGVISPTLMPFEKRKTRTERQPRDTHEKVHHAMDKWFFNNFGHHYRSQSVAAIGDPVEANSYGKLCYIFPIGRFSFLWTEDAPDIGARVERYAMVEKGKTGQRDTDLDQTSQKEVEEIVGQILEKMTFWESDPEEAVRSGHEIMIAVDEYYLLDLRSEGNDMEAEVSQRLRSR